MVVGHVFLFDGSECAQTDVQQHGHDVDALLLDFFEQFRRKVQAGRRRGSAAVHLGIDGLVARLIFQFFVDIRRQGHLAEAVEHILEHALIEEAHGAPAVFADGQDFGDELAVAEHEARAGLGLFAGLENDFPIGEVETAEEQKFDCAARAFLHAVQARGDDARLVDDEHVAGVEVIDHVAEDFMLDRAGIAMVDEQAAAIARFDGGLRDEFLRKFIIKITGFHGNSLFCARATLGCRPNLLGVLDPKPHILPCGMPQGNMWEVKEPQVPSGV